MSHHNVEEQIGGAHHFPDLKKMVECGECITVQKCCGELFADGSCCGMGEPLVVSCPPCSFSAGVA